MWIHKTDKCMHYIDGMIEINMLYFFPYHLVQTPSSSSTAQSVPIDTIPVQTPSSTSTAQSVPIDTTIPVQTPSSTSTTQFVPIETIPVQMPSSTSNAQSVPIDTILAVVFGIFVIFLLLVL